MQVTALGNVAMSYSYVPPDAPLESRLKIFDEARIRALMEIWPSTPQTVLGGKSPADLANDASRRGDARAAVHRVILTQTPPRLREEAQAVWGRLGLEPLPRSVDPAGIPDERLWFVRVERVDTTKLSDERLAKVTLDAALANATSAIAHVAPELMRRPQLHRTVNMFAMVNAAVGEARSFSVAGALLEDARRLVAPEIVPPGLWDVMEFESAIDRLEVKRAGDLFVKAAEAANRNKIVGQAFFRALANRGLVAPNGRLRIPVSQTPDAGPLPDPDDEQPGKPTIWTPETAATQEGKGKIWLPS
jgi:hypothetical protein